MGALRITFEIGYIQMCKKIFDGDEHKNTKYPSLSCSRLWYFPLNVASTGRMSVQGKLVSTPLSSAELQICFLPIGISIMDAFALLKVADRSLGGSWLGDLCLPYCRGHEMAFLVWSSCRHH